MVNAMYTSFQIRTEDQRILNLVLKVLELSNFAIVDSLRIELSNGLNVLTGETGAGKSILIDALSLLIGGRADSSWIRSGADSALIQGIFSSKAGLESAARRLSSSRSLQIYVTTISDVGIAVVTTELYRRPHFLDVAVLVSDFQDQKLFAVDHPLA